MPMLRQTFARVDLSALRHNIRAVKAFLPTGVRLLMVVKADGYGHGLEAVGRVAQQEKADYLGTALAEEGLALRQAGVSMPVMCFGAINQAGFDALAEGEITATIPDLRSAWMAARAAEKAKKPLTVHLKLETGMNRVGIAEETELLKVLEAIDASPLLRLEGAYTHFADADRPDSGYTHRQAERFRQLAALLPGGLVLHAGASGGALLYPEYHFGMVRIGSALYGAVAGLGPLRFKPCLELISEVTFVKTVRKGQSVSYGCTFTAPSDMRVATVAIGYGDGYRRAFGNRARVLIRGRSCPIIGRVCMDQCMADVSAVPETEPGDEVVLLGARGEESITASELAKLCDTVHYEILTAPSRRVPRIYIDDKETQDAAK